MANGVPNRKPFAERLRVSESLTFDDVLLRPMESRIGPDDADMSTRVSKNVELNTLTLLATMDTVAESGMVTRMVHEGGLGVLHRSMNAEQMVREIERVKRADKLVIRREDMAMANPGQTINEVDEVMERIGVSGAPIIGDDDVVLGTISGIDIRPYLEVDEPNEVGEAMADEVITAERDMTTRDALELMYDYRIERVSIVDDDSCLAGLVTMQGILQRHKHESTIRDDDGRLVCGVAVGPSGDERARMADDAGAGVISIDRAYTHNPGVIDTTRSIKGSVKADTIVKNVGTCEATAELVDFADGIKTSIGPGSICTTRVVPGSDVPQILAIAEVADVAANHDIPVIADGSIRYSDDTIKAVVADADAVMLDSYFAGTDEAPDRVITMNSKKHKQHCDMGSVGAMQSGGTDRCLKEDNGDEKYAPGSVGAVTSYKGSLVSELHQLIGGIQSGIGYVDAEIIPKVKKRVRFVCVSAASQTGGHPHDAMITDEAPSYSLNEQRTPDRFVFPLFPSPHCFFSPLLTRRPERTRGGNIR